MNSFDLDIILLEDAVFSERTATEGGHRGLSYIPGATLLGAAASRLYPSLTHQEAFDLFHSGRVRFGNGLPVDEDGEMAYPIPFCWHSLKGETCVEDKIFQGEKIWNLSLEEPPKDKQPSQLRACFVTAFGREVKPENNLRMKTSIDPDTAMAKEAALFGYDALPAGSRFRASIGIDKDIPLELIESLHDALTKHPLLLGRSRSAEYGRATVVCRPFSAYGNTVEAGQAVQRVTLWLLSDLAASDKNGQPCLYPNPQSLGLPEGQLLTDKSFIRTRRYSPWNAYRGGPDLERQVIVQGSVLVFEFNKQVNLTQQHLQRMQSGLGLHREAGLGQVWLEPTLLKTLHPQFPNKPSEHSPTTPHSLSKSPLISWLENNRNQQINYQEERQLAVKLAHEYRELLVSARKLKGLADKTPIGPSASQWGNVGEAAKSASNDNDLDRRLFDNQVGCCKTKAPGWEDEFYLVSGDENKIQKFAEWLKSPQQPLNCRILQHLAREIQAILNKEKQQ
jgi:hypothetical protein